MAIIIVHQKRSALHLTDVHYVGRPTPLGNPFSHLAKNTLALYRTDTVEQAVNLYNTHFYQTLMTIPSARMQFKTLVDHYRKHGILYISCWCKDELDPKPYDHPCHCDALRDAIYWTLPALQVMSPFISIFANQQP